MVKSGAAVGAQLDLDERGRWVTKFGFNSFCFGAGELGQVI